MNPVIGTNDSRPLSQRVVEKVADAKDADPTELEPLYRRVDPDCLDMLFSNGSQTVGRSQGHIAFPMAGCQVVVHADGTVEVDSTDSEARASAPGVQDTASPKVSESPE